MRKLVHLPSERKGGHSPVGRCSGCPPGHCSHWLRKPFRRVLCSPVRHGFFSLGLGLPSSLTRTPSPCYLCCRLWRIQSEHVDAFISPLCALYRRQHPFSYVRQWGGVQRCLARSPPCLIPTQSLSSWDTLSLVQWDRAQDNFTISYRFSVSIYLFSPRRGKSQHIMGHFPSLSLLFSSVNQRGFSDVSFLYVWHCPISYELSAIARNSHPFSMGTIKQECL